MNFAFDVDGTLTLSRQSIDPEFQKWFLSFCQSNTVYLVTGSDYVKTVEQLGEDICNTVAGIYSCCGNALYINGELQYSNHFELTADQENFLTRLLNASSFPFKTGIHIEKRPGLVNFSIVGRNATMAQRHYYSGYDYALSERKNLAELIESEFPELDAKLGGDTGIDIYPKGKDKSQIVDKIKPFVFFGDKIYPGGNDYTIAQHAEVCYNVLSHEETFNILKKDYSI